MLTVISIVAGLIISILGFFLRYLLTTIDKKFELIFDKLEDLAKVSELEKLEAKIEKEVEKREAKFNKLEDDLSALKDRMNKCKSCNV